MRFGYRLYEHNTGDLTHLVDEYEECYDDVPEAESTMEELVAQKAELVAEHEGE
ncbi:hypothetical protein [Bacillus sp. FJAT-27916]|uniref:hypothetical protein n=1 Tax=Bacillus sp. FJAT-27916 TaxID=1679169 RepID=UPI000A5E24E1|nr:hypothetical protein [Bacillus sp. FJAT-27916]